MDHELYWIEPPSSMSKLVSSVREDSPKIPNHVYYVVIIMSFFKQIYINLCIFTVFDVSLFFGSLKMFRSRLSENFSSRRSLLG